MALTFGNFHVSEEGEKRRPGRPRLTPEGSATSENKTSVYFKGSTLEDMRSLAARKGRSLSWMLSYAWDQAREALETLPDV